MRCIFCKADSSSSKSVEHIIPESLGNKSHVLPKGVVCDSCNNYFATKIEKEVLNSGYFKSLRHRNEILNKKGNIPMETAIIAHPNGDKIEVNFHGNIVEAVIPSRKVFDLVKSGTVNKLYIPIYQQPEPKNSFVSRLIGKVALEALARRVYEVEDWNEEFVRNESLDSLRNYVRYGIGTKFWQYHQRKIYDENHAFQDSMNTARPEKYQVLHEYDFIFINKELYFVCAIMGVEYTINLGGDEVENYTSWLSKNNSISPLQMEHEQKVTHNEANK